MEQSATGEIKKIGEFTTAINKETYSIGFVNGWLSVWAPEVGVDVALGSSHRTKTQCKLRLFRACLAPNTLAQWASTMC
jgi:hypothetical protein